MSAHRFNPFYAIPITMVIMFVVRVPAAARAAQPRRHKGDVVGVIVTFGISIVLMNAMQQALHRQLHRHERRQDRDHEHHHQRQLAIGWLPLIFFILSVVVIAALQLYMGRTKMGRAFRAVSDDTDAARLMGINTKHIWAMAMAVALLIVSIGGVMMGIRSNFNPTAR